MPPSSGRNDLGLEVDMDIDKDIDMQSIIIQKFEVFKPIEISVEVFWVVTQCSVVIRYQCF